MTPVVVGITGNYWHELAAPKIRMVKKWPKEPEEKEETSKLVG